MKALLFFAALVTTAFGYGTKYDNIDLEQILRSHRLYTKYFNCLANTGHCTPDGQELKDILPEALATDCLKCNERQKTSAQKVLKFMINNKPEDYSVLEKIYDPEGSYRKKYSAEAERRRIHI